MRVPAAVLLALAAVCLSAPSVRAWPFFKSRIPNGNSVPCPPGVDGRGLHSPSSQLCHELFVSNHPT